MRAKAFAWLVVLGATAAPAGVFAGALEPAPAGIDAQSIARSAENNLRSDRTYFDARMIVRSPRLSSDRVVAFRSWEDRPNKRSLIRISKPVKDAGSGFLKLHPNLWMYVPRVERTVRIPPSMMLQSWMGSDFNNDDLVRESSEIEDYDHRLLGIDPAPEGAASRRCYVVEYTPHEETAVVWGRIVSWIDVEKSTPVRQEFFDEAGEKLRVLSFDDIREVQGREVPHRWTLTPLDKPGHRTVIELHEIQFDPEIDEAIFTTRHLKRSR